MCVFMISKQGRAEHHRIVVACRWITSEPFPMCARTNGRFTPSVPQG